MGLKAARLEARADDLLRLQLLCIAKISPVNPTDTCFSYETEQSR